MAKKKELQMICDLCGKTITNKVLLHKDFLRRTQCQDCWNTWQSDKAIFFLILWFIFGVPFALAVWAILIVVFPPQ